MSHAATHWAWTTSGITGTEKLVLLRLADAANDDGECWPSHEKISADTGLGRSTVARCVGSLVALGLVVRETRRSNGHQTSNIYRLAAASPSEQLVAGSVSERAGQLLGASSKSVRRTNRTTSKNEVVRRDPDDNGYSAQDAVAFLVDEAGRRSLTITPRLKGQAAKILAGLVAAGVSPQVIEDATALMLEKGTNPATLDSLVLTVEAKQKRNGMPWAGMSDDEIIRKFGTPEEIAELNGRSQA